MNSIAQFRQYVNTKSYFHNGHMCIEWKGVEYRVATLWNLINMGLFNF